MSDRSINPLGNLYSSFMTLLKGTTIKYTGKAEEYETLEIRMSSDAYLDAVNNKDTFFSYLDYTESELLSVGITDIDIINQVLQRENINVIPERYRDKLFSLRHERELRDYEEKNNYYRMLNGLPDIGDTEFFYVPSDIMMEYEMDARVPIHMVQDYYNNKISGRGDYLIAIIENTGYIDELQEKHPEKKYLKYLGSNRISIYRARNAKNFQIIQLHHLDVKSSLVDEYMRIYEQCREYFVKTIYIHTYRDFFERYDNFIALCIMVMTTQQLVMRQLSSYINRDFFDINAIRMLYEAYDIPFDITIDEDTQALLVRNINMLIQNKATDKVLFNIANLLGFSNITIYKYFLAKERKFDSYGVPIVKWTTRFNTETGETEAIPDYNAMYDLYFQKADISKKDFINTFNDSTNHVTYEEVTEADPFWIEDQGLYERVWQTEYNFVESKYLGLGISYSMTEMMFENVLFLKLIMQKSDDLESVRIQLPRITQYESIPIFDIIISLLCLTACKHNLYGEIITVPTQVISVLDYIKNTEYGDTNLDTLKFNFNYFFNPDEKDDNDEVEEFRKQLSEHMSNLNKSDTLVDTFQFNFDYINPKKETREEELKEMEEILETKDYKLFRYYVDIISQDTSKSSNKINAINEIYSNIKNLKVLLNYYMTKVCNNRRDYEKLKQLYDTLFYSQEMADLFTITGEITGHKRTAYTYFEYLYHRNPTLYNALFRVDLNEEYFKYLKKESKSTEEYPFEVFLVDIEYGNVFIDYSTFIWDEADTNETETKTQKLYYYVNHIISRVKSVIAGIDFLYTMNDSETPLEELLMRLLRFFKSYTVDIINMDTLYICDQKPENTVKFFDEIYYIQKLIQTDEKLHISYGDAIHLIQAYLSTGEAGSVRLQDKMFYEKILLIDNLVNNSVRLKDMIYSITKDIEVDDEAVKYLNDYINIESNVYTNDSVKLKDRIVRLWYTD